LKSPLFPDEKKGIDQLETRLASSSGEERIEILTKLTEAYQGKEPRKVLTYGQEALELLETISTPTYRKHRAVLLNSLSSASSILGNLREAETYARQSQALAREIGDKTGLANALYNLAWVYSFHANYARAREFCSRAQTLYEEISDQKGLAQSFYLRAYIYWRLSDYTRAMDYVFKSGEIYKTLDEPRGTALLDKLTGNIYADLGKYEKTLNYYFKSQQVFRELGDKEQLSQILSNIGYVYNRLKNHSQALYYYNQSLEISRKSDSKQNLSYTLNNMGEVYADMGDYPQALDYFRQSLQIKEDINDQMGIAYTLINLGRAQRKQGRYKEAAASLNRALVIASQINTRNEIRNANQELAEIYKALKDYPKALHYLKKYKEINDWIFNETSSRKIAEMQTRYEMEKNKKEIALLKKNKAIRELALTRQRYFNYFIIIISLLVFIVGFVIYTRYRLKVKMSKALLEEIREHKQTTRKLQENEEKFRTLAETSVVGIYISQLHVIKYVNPKFLTIFGATREEIIGENFLKLVYEEDHPQVIEKINQRTAGAVDNPGYEFRGLTRDGDIIHLESYGGLTHYQGQPAILETIIDITNRKKNAEKLLNSHKLEAVGILTGGIAHDFNNLLAIIVGYLDLVKDEIQTGTPAYRLAENIENNCDRAAALGEELTFFAKGGWITPQNVTLSTILNGAFEEHPEIQTLVNHVSIQADLRTIYGDERQLKQMVFYLLSGVDQIKTNKKNRGPVYIQVNITAENVDLDEENDFSLPKGEYVRVFFKDNGRGIPAEQLEKVFEPSFSPATSRNRPGMGLELAICRSIARKHNGHIAAVSKVGKGTTLELILPTYKEQ